MRLLALFIVPFLVCTGCASAGMTTGLSEFIAVPQALWWLLTDRGQKTLRVLYREDSRYKLHFVIKPFLSGDESDVSGGWLPSLTFPFGGPPPLRHPHPTTHPATATK